MKKTLVVRRGSWLALLAGATLLALAAWLAVTGLARADVSSLGIGSATVAPGDSVTLSVTAEATAPGIGNATIDVVYDGALVDATACSAASGTCTIDIVGANTVRLVDFWGAATGQTGTVTLGTITFEAGQTEGTAALTVTVDNLGDADDVDITVTPTDGTITIVAPTPAPTPTPTAEPTAEPTATPVVLPPTGGSPAGGSGSADWLLASVIGLGLAALGTGAWAVARMRR